MKKDEPRDMDDTRFALKKAQETIRSLEEELSETNRGLMALTTELEKANERLKEEIEERKRAEESVRAERQRLYEVLETLPVYVCLLDADYYMPFANRYFRETFGEPRGQRCHDVLFNRTEPCEICESYTAMKTGAPHHWYWTGPNGRDYDIYDFPFTDSDGSMLVLEMGIDITDRKRAEAELIRANESLSEEISERIRAEKDRDRFFSLSSDMLCFAGFDGYFKQINPAFSKTLGWSADELLSKPWIEFVHPDDREKTDSAKEQLVSGNTLYSFENRYKCKDGSYRWLWWNSFPLRDENLVFAIARDITERKHMEEELIRSNQDLQQFAYVASHDLQEPLRNVASCLQMLEKKYKNKLGADADQYIHHAVEGAVRMKALILDLLAYSRVATRGKSPARIDCEQLLDHTVKNLRSAIAESGAAITHNHLPTVPADDSQLSQVFQNLIQNAIKFRRHDDPPKVHISAVKNKYEWVFSVQDNGIGIESRHLDRIFVIFQRLHKRSQYEGTGMGLAIVKKVVERHGGRVWVESEPGVGTTFFFTIPEKGMQS